MQSRHTLDPGGSIAEKSGDGGQGVNTHIHTCSSCLINERASREKDVMGGSGDKGATHTHTHTFSSCLISAILMGPSTARSLSQAPRQPALLELGRPLRARIGGMMSERMHGSARVAEAGQTLRAKNERMSERKAAQVCVAGAGQSPA